MKFVAVGTQQVEARDAGTGIRSAWCLWVLSGCVAVMLRKLWCIGRNRGDMSLGQG